MSIVVFENEMPVIKGMIRAMNNAFGRGDVMNIHYNSGGVFGVTCKLQCGQEIYRAWKDEQGFLHYRGRKRKIKVQ